MNKMFSTILLMCLAALCCNGQTFLDKHPRLTKKDLPKFFSDWKAYSDSVSATVKCNSEICNVVNAEFDSTFRVIRALQGNTSLFVVNQKYRYEIIPQEIPVEYYPITPTPNDTVFFSYDYNSMYENILVKDTITPILRPNELYLTEKISDRLMEFIAEGDIYKERPHKFIKKNIRELSRYIYCYNGDHNGWVDFNDYPYIHRVQATNDFIVLHIQSWICGGHECWYIKQDNEFIKMPGIRNAWIE